MALTPQNQDAFLREVDDELRKEQFTTFWRRYGRWLIAAVVVGLAALGGFLFWQAEQAKNAGIEGEKFDKLLTDLGQGKKDGAAAALDPMIASSHPGYKAGARLTKAALAVEKDEVPAAIAQYKLITDDPKMPQPYRDLALIRRTMLEYDTLAPAQVVDRLKPLAVPGNPWFGSAGEMVAVAYMRMNKPELAGPLFAAIAKDEQVPESIRGRVVRLAGVLGVDAVAQPAATKE